MRFLPVLAVLALLVGGHAPTPMALVTGAQAQPLILPCIPSGINCIPVSAANPLPTTGGATFPPAGCVTANGVIFNNATPCDSGLIYTGSGGPLETNVGAVTTPVISNNVSPTSGFYYSANGLGFGFASAGVNKFDCLVTAGSTCTVPTGVNFTVTTGNVNIPSLGLSGGGNITFSTRTKITSNSADGGLLISNNGGTQSYTITTSATAGQATFGAGIAGTFPTATGADVVCNAGTGGSPLTLQVSATGCAASSARFKEGIASLNRQKALDDVLRFEPVSYFYKPEFNMGSDRHVGFTAEQIGSVDSQWITYEDDGVTPHAVKYNEMAPLFAAAIQKLKAEIDELKRK